MGYWKSKVLPKLKKAFDLNSSKKAAAAEACKSFDDSKDAVNKEFEEKRTELQPKVVEIYEASSVEIKGLVKERNDAGIKKNSAAVVKLLEELVKIEFPGSKAVSEVSSKFGAGLVPGPVLFVLEKVSTFVVDVDDTELGGAGDQTSREVVAVEEEKDKEVAGVVVQQGDKEEAAAAASAAAAAEEIKDAVVEEETIKKEPEAAKLEEAPKHP
ncbi:hypothetical protein Scep_011128 [Stephania cephalantha]|uniref:Plasma membrane-associated cation-binding protein 1 n=1 Tax=Stephania cephalantha TaxID=152367 RepID=A0AAP0JDL0_9MAGN